MKSHRQANIVGAKPQFIRNINDGGVQANRIIQTLAQSDRQNVKAITNILDLTVDNLQRNLDRKNIRIVDLIMGRMASLLDETIASMNKDELSKLRSDIQLAISNSQSNKLTKADKAEIISAISQYIDNKKNLIELKAEVTQLKQQNILLSDKITQSAKTTTLAATSSNATIAASVDKLDVQMRSMNMNFSMITSQLQQVFTSINSISMQCGQTIAMIEALQTTMLAEQLNKWGIGINGFFTSMFQAVGEVFDGKAGSYFEPKKHTMSETDKVHRYVDFASIQIIEAIKNHDFGISYKLDVINSNIGQVINMLNKRLSIADSDKAEFQSASIDDAIENIRHNIGKYHPGEAVSLSENEQKLLRYRSLDNTTYSRLFDPYVANQKKGFMEDPFMWIADGFRKFITGREHIYDPMSNSDIRQLNELAQNSEKAFESALKGQGIDTTWVQNTSAQLTNIDDNVKKIISGGVADSLPRDAAGRTEEEQKLYISQTAESVRVPQTQKPSTPQTAQQPVQVVQPTQQKNKPQNTERTWMDSFSNFFTMIGNICEWLGAPNGGQKFWEHFGLGSLPSLVTKLEKIIPNSLDGVDFNTHIGKIVDAMLKPDENGKMPLTEILSNSFSGSSIGSGKGFSKITDSIVNKLQDTKVIDRIVNSLTSEQAISSIASGIIPKIDFNDKSSPSLISDEQKRKLIDTYVGAFCDPTRANNLVTQLLNPKHKLVDTTIQLLLSSPENGKPTRLETLIDNYLMANKNVTPPDKPPQTSNESDFSIWNALAPKLFSPDNSKIIVDKIFAKDKDYVTNIISQLLIKPENGSSLFQKIVERFTDSKSVDLFQGLPNTPEVIATKLKIASIQVKVMGKFVDAISNKISAPDFNLSDIFVSTIGGMFTTTFVAKDKDGKSYEVSGAQYLIDKMLNGSGGMSEETKKLLIDKIKPFDLNVFASTFIDKLFDASKGESYVTKIIKSFMDSPTKDGQKGSGFSIKELLDLPYMKDGKDSKLTIKQALGIRLVETLDINKLITDFIKNMSDKPTKGNNSGLGGMMSMFGLGATGFIGNQIKDFLNTEFELSDTTYNSLYENAVAKSLFLDIVTTMSGDGVTNSASSSKTKKTTLKQLLIADMAIKLLSSNFITNILDIVKVKSETFDVNKLIDTILNNKMPTDVRTGFSWLSGVKGVNTWNDAIGATMVKKIETNIKLEDIVNNSVKEAVASKINVQNLDANNLKLVSPFDDNQLSGMQTAVKDQIRTSFDNKLAVLESMNEHITYTQEYLCALTETLSIKLNIELPQLKKIDSSPSTKPTSGKVAPTAAAARSRKDAIDTKLHTPPQSSHNLITTLR